MFDGHLFGYVNGVIQSLYAYSTHKTLENQLK